jgi:hypothetical protein
MNLFIHFLDEIVISGTIDDPFDTDNTKVLIAGSLTDIISQIKK